MDNYSVAGITVSTFFDTRRVKDNLMFPVKYRVTFKRERVYYPSGIDLSEEHWNSLETTKKRDLLEIKKLVQSGFERIKNHIQDIVTEDNFSFQELNRRLNRNVQNSIFYQFDQKITRLKEEGRVTTASSNECAKKSISKFTKNKDIKFTDITVDWLKKYEKYMLENDNSITTVGIYLRALRAILNEEKSFLTVSQYPFGKGKYEIKKGTGRKMALTLTQINKILKYKLTTNNEKMCRDLWYFSFLCNGVNINDLLRLKYSNIINDEIHFNRGKTLRTNHELKEIQATHLPEMKRIIKRWGNPPSSPKRHIFPFLKDGLDPFEERKIIQRVTWLINDKMSMIGESLNYGNLTTYSARHSFASVLKHNNVNIAFISEQLGHKDLKTTESYLASFDKEERAKNASLLTKFK